MNFPELTFYAGLNVVAYPERYESGERGGQKAGQKGIKASAVLLNPLLHLLKWGPTWPGLQCCLGHIEEGCSSPSSACATLASTLESAYAARCFLTG